MRSEPEGTGLLPEKRPLAAVCLLRLCVWSYSPLLTIMGLRSHFSSCRVLPTTRDERHGQVYTEIQPHAHIAIDALLHIAGRTVSEETGLSSIFLPIATGGVSRAPRGLI